MNERGWGWTASEIRRVHLLEWIAEASVGHPERYINVKAFYDGRSDQSKNDFGVARTDFAALVQERQIMDGSGIGGIESMAAMLAPQGHDFLEQLRARRAKKGQRRTACRDAMVAWLYSADATNRVRRSIRHRMLEDPQYGIWLAALFDPVDLADAALWLQDKGLVDGLGADQATGPLQLYLTSPGIACAERFNSDTRRYQEERMGQRSGPTVTIGNNSGPL